MNARFKELRKALGLTQEEFAEKTKLSRSYINLIEMGKKVPAERTTQDICRIFNVNCDWLVHGEGDMFQDTNLNFGNICALIGANDEKAKAAIIKYYQLSQEDKELFWKFMERFIDKESGD